MNAGDIILSALFPGMRKFEIPFYQRAYVWKEEQWSRLLEDFEFISTHKSPYFLGSIILKAGKVNTWNVITDKKIIIDGQQRLTTILLFLRAFWLKKGEISEFNKQFQLKDKSICLDLGVNDDESFKIVMNHNSTDLIDESSIRTSNIIPAFNYFLKNINVDKINIYAVLGNVQLVCIDLAANDEEQQVFDTINSLGVRLTTAELLKNYFYGRQDYESYQQNWKQVFENDEETRLYWNQEFEVGRSKRALIDIFLDAYFQFFVQNPEYKVSAEDKITYSRVGHLAKSYQDFIHTYCNDNKNVVLSALPQYAKEFRETFDPKCLDRSLPKEFSKEHMNVIIFGLKTTTLIPYVLYVAKNVKDEKERNKIYQVLEAYIMRRMVTREDTKGYNRLFTSLILNKILTADNLIDFLTKNKEVSTFLPDDNELSSGFQDSKLVNLQTKGIIYFIESGIRSDMNATSLLGFNHYSLEHLMPKKWRNHWQPCASDELARKRDSKLLTLGNLAIIPQPLNTSVRDADWKTKKEGKGDKKCGLIACAAGLVTLSNVIMQDSWDEGKIQNRALWLYEKAKELWTINV